MEKLKFEKNEELKSYEMILNGIIAVNIGVAIIPFDNLSSWERFLNNWASFQKENRKDITLMIRQFGKDQDGSFKKSQEDEAVHTREKFLKEVQNLGFPVNIQGPQALAMRREEPLENPSQDMETNASSGDGKGKEEGQR